MSCSRLIVRGVPVEWIEATVATTGQTTLIHLVGGDPLGPSLVTARPLLGRLAAATGARVFSVGTRPTSADRFLSAVEDGVAAYAWLLDEGLDLQKTAFVGDEAGNRLNVAVMEAAREDGLPVPGATLGTHLLRLGAVVNRPFQAAQRPTLPAIAFARRSL